MNKNILFSLLMLGAIVVSACGAAAKPAWDNVPNPPQLDLDFRGDEIFEIWTDSKGRVWGAFSGDNSATIWYTVDEYGKVHLAREFWGFTEITPELEAYAQYFRKGTGASVAEAYLEVLDGKVVLWMPDRGVNFDIWAIYETPTEPELRGFAKWFEDAYVDLCFTWDICWDDLNEVGTRQGVIDPVTKKVTIVDYEYVISRSTSNSPHLQSPEAYRQWLKPQLVEDFSILARATGHWDWDTEPMPTFGPVVSDPLDRQWWGKTVIEEADGDWLLLDIGQADNWYNPATDQWMRVCKQGECDMFAEGWKRQMKFLGEDPSITRTNWRGNPALITPRKGVPLNWAIETGLISQADAPVTVSRYYQLHIDLYNGQGLAIMDPGTFQGTWDAQTGKLYSIDMGRVKFAGNPDFPSREIYLEFLENRKVEDLAYLNLAAVVAPQDPVPGPTTRVSVFSTVDGQNHFVDLTADELRILRTGGDDAVRMLAGKNLPMPPPSVLGQGVKIIGRGLIYALDIAGVAYMGYEVVETYWEAMGQGQEVQLSTLSFANLQNLSPTAAEDSKWLVANGYENTPVFYSYVRSLGSIQSDGVNNTSGVCKSYRLDSPAQIDIPGFFPDNDVVSPVIGCGSPIYATLINTTTGERSSWKNNGTFWEWVEGPVCFNWVAPAPNNTGSVMVIAPFSTCVDGASGLVIWRSTWMDAP